MATTAIDLFEKARNHERLELLRAATEHDLNPYFRLMEGQAGPVVEMEGAERVMLGSNNYLGLTRDQRVRDAARAALDEYGTALTGSRFLNGTLPIHLELERELAEWMGTEAALVFTTGYQANVGCLSAILSPVDTVICDSGDHASIMDGVAMSRAKVRPFRHKRLDKLETMLERAASDGGGVLVVVDGVYSMEGDICDVPRVAELAAAHGARLMVDEAHGVGVLGARGAGACEALGVEDQVDLRMGTFSKSLASCGGFIAGSSEVIEFLRYQSRSFMFTASAVPAAVGAALAAVRICRSAEGPELFARVLECRVPALGAGGSRLRRGRHRRARRRRRGAPLAGRAGAGGRRLEGRAAVEGALRRRRLHERRPLPGGRARRRAAADERDGHARARAPRPGARGVRALPADARLSWQLAARSWQA